MKMNWFKKQHSVCQTCGVHFEPRNDAWANLCLEHARPVMERDRKRDAVTQWARENFEKLYEQYEKDYAAKNDAYNAMAQGAMNSMAAQALAQQQAAAQGNIYGLHGFVGLR